VCGGWREGQPAPKWAVPESLEGINRGQPNAQHRLDTNVQGCPGLVEPVDRGVYALPFRKKKKLQGVRKRLNSEIT